MNKNRIFGYVAMGLPLLIIISIFLPYMSFYSISTSLWKAEDPSRIILIILSLFVIALFLINKKTEMSYILAGYGTFYQINMLIQTGELSYFSIGFYLILLASIAIGVMTFLYKEEEGQAIINITISKNKNIQQVQQQIIGYDTNTGNPIYSDSKKM